MKQNMEATEEKRDAYHEAGHAVARVLLDLPFDSVSIETKKMETGNGCWPYVEGVKWTDDYTRLVKEEIQSGKLDLRLALSLMAGLAAEIVLLGKRDELAHRGAKNDRQRIIDCCHNACGAGGRVASIDWKNMGNMIINAVLDESKKLLSENWAFVEEVANALLEHERLTRDDVEKLARRPGLA